MKINCFAKVFITLTTVSCLMDGQILQAASQDYDFQAGFPTSQTIQKAYDDADLNRAIQAYKFFYPTVSIAGTWKGNLDIGMVPNQVFGILQGSPEQLAFTPNSDTPYAGILLDLTSGPFVVEIPPGPLMCVVNDLNQRYVMDLGLPGPDKGKGGKHLILPPNYKGQTPPGYFTGVSSTNRVLLMLRAIPPKGDTKAAISLIKMVKVYPFKSSTGWQQPKWININDQSADLTALSLETNLQYWEALHNVIDKEPPYEPYRNYYGELAALGIVKGKPFAPDSRMQDILRQAVQIANAQMRVQSFADRRPDRIVWQDRQWEWATLRPENGAFDTSNYVDLTAREKWFYQAQIASPAMFRRTPGTGSLYWFNARDKKGNFLDGNKTYKLSVPQPIPANLFWSVTVYDPDTRSEIRTDQNKAALRSLFELKNVSQSGPVNLYFGPQAPIGHENQWIQTIPGQGWFVYFRLYGPEESAFNGQWKPGDFEVMQ